MAEGEALGKVQRTVEILRILYRNDFFGMLRELAQAEREPGPHGGAIRIPPEVPRKVRMILEELGPTFVKIGQLLGTRPDLVPKAFIDEFRGLYDETTPNTFHEIRAVVETELGRPLEEVFLEFHETPVASASVGQVHFAVLRTGERVAVKCQHPDIEQRVFVDFQIMEPIVRFIENLFAASRVWQPREHLREVYDMLVRELDYRYEARNTQQVYENFKGDPSVKIPKVHWEYSTKRMLCLERIEGYKLSDFENPDLRALDGKQIAEIITHAMAKQIFEDRLFHADPSPGNLKVLSSDEVAFLDFGAVGKVTRRRSEQILQLIVGFVRNDLESVSQSLVDLCNRTGEVDMRAFQRDVERVMDYHERERASVGDPVVLDMIVQAAQEHDMLLPSDFLLINRALFQFEGLCKKLDPDYELVEVLQPYILRFVRREMFSFEKQREAMLDLAFQTSALVMNAPSRINSLARRIENNDLKFKVELASIPDYQQREDRRIMRSTFTTIVSAIILGVAVLIGLGQSALLLPFFFAATLLVLLWAFVMLYWSES